MRFGAGNCGILGQTREDRGTRKCCRVFEMLEFGRDSGCDFCCSWGWKRSQCVDFPWMEPLIPKLFLVCRLSRHCGGGPTRETSLLLSGLPFYAVCGWLQSRTFEQSVFQGGLASNIVLQSRELPISGGSPKAPWKVPLYQERVQVWWLLRFSSALLPQFSFIWRFSYRTGGLGCFRISGRSQAGEEKAVKMPSPASMHKAASWLCDPGCSPRHLDPLMVLAAGGGSQDSKEPVATSLWGVLSTVGATVRTMLITCGNECRRQKPGPVLRPSNCSPHFFLWRSQEGGTCAHSKSQGRGPEGWPTWSRCEPGHHFTSSAVRSRDLLNHLRVTCMSLYA